jgi:hypothetical protein
MTWHHPTYYKKIRAERKKIPVSGMENRATGSSDNLNAENSERFVDQASSKKPQAASVKHQANQGTRNKVQAPSG